MPSPHHIQRGTSQVSKDTVLCEEAPASFLKLRGLGENACSLQCPLSGPWRHVYCNPQPSPACSAARTDFPSQSLEQAPVFSYVPQTLGQTDPALNPCVAPVSCVSLDKMLYLSLPLILNTGIISSPIRHRFIPREKTQAGCKCSTDMGKHHYQCWWQTDYLNIVSFIIFFAPQASFNQKIIRIL